MPDISMTHREAVQAAALPPNFDIAIDGPVAAGKGTVSKLLAERLGFLYVDTGAMYRVVALLALRSDIPLEGADELAALVEKSDIDMHPPKTDEQDGRLTTVLLNGEDVSWQIRTTQVSQTVPIVAAHPQVRGVLVHKQQQIAAKHNVVMEGRDITTKVLPKAALKIFLTARPEVRIQRRFAQLADSGVSITFAEVAAQLRERDDLDMNRATDPLRQAPDAWLVDTSDLAIETVVDLIVARVEQLRSKFVIS